MRPWHRETGLSAEEFFWIGLDEPCELVEGKIVWMSPANYLHGRTMVRVSAALEAWARRSKLGRVVSGDVGFILRRNPDTVRAPDVAYVVRERQPTREKASFFYDGPPDLAIEIVSPSQRWPELERKAREYLHAGTLAVWIVDPDDRTARIYRGADVVPLAADGELADAALLPGFALGLVDLFADE